MTMQSIMPGTTHELGGAKYTYRLTGGESGGQGALVEVTVEPKTFFAIPHVHEKEDEWIYIIEGICRAQVGDETFMTGAGDTVYVPRGTAHALANAGDTPARLLFIFTPAGMEPFFAEIAAALPDAPPFPLAAFDDFNGFVDDMLQSAPEAGQIMETVMNIWGKYNMRPPTAE